MPNSRFTTRRALKQRRSFCDAHHKHRLLNVARRRYAATASSLEVRHANDDPHLNAMEDVRLRFANSRIFTSIAIVDTLRKWYPNHIVTQTPQSTGILRLAKAGQAEAKLDTKAGYYGSRIYKPPRDEPTGPGRLKDEVEFGRYKYRWNDHDFQVYVADYSESEWNQIQNHYILYPRRQDDVKDGRSRIVDELITAASRHEAGIDDEIWVYDRGYWRKSHKLWQNVQASKWETVILHADVKCQLITDVEGFFDRKEDYESFAVPRKVSRHIVQLFHNCFIS
jgi:transitional endoplasmic reticulum ATPase